MRLNMAVQGAAPKASMSESAKPTLDIPAQVCYMEATMKDDSQLMVEKFGKRSFAAVMAFTIFFAMAGAMLVTFGGGSAIWGVWIPFVCFTIPAIHYLCREVLHLRQRLTDLEKRLESR